VVVLGLALAVAAGGAARTWAPLIAKRRPRFA
jgi:hypothetical protein